MQVPSLPREALCSSPRHRVCPHSALWRGAFLCQRMMIVRELYKQVQIGLMQAASLGFLSAPFGNYAYQFSQTPTIRTAVILVTAALGLVVIGSLLAQKLRELRAQLH